MNEDLRKRYKEELYFFKEYQKNNDINIYTGKTKKNENDNFPDNQVSLKEIPSKEEDLNDEQISNHIFNKEKEMFEAIQEQDYYKIELLLEEGYYINHQNQFGFWEKEDTRYDYGQQPNSFYSPFDISESRYVNDEHQRTYNISHNYWYDRDLNTPLHYAVYVQDFLIIYFLFMNGADAEIENLFNQKPYEICCMNDSDSCLMACEFLYYLNEKYGIKFIKDFRSDEDYERYLERFSIRKYDGKHNLQIFQKCLKDINFTFI